MQAGTNVRVSPREQGADVQNAGRLEDRQRSVRPEPVGKTLQCIAVVMPRRQPGAEQCDAAVACVRCAEQGARDAVERRIVSPFRAELHRDP